ncbi:MAG TPA: hypothetical protein VH684_01420 [Xanthobacteraceae bacterium]
MRALFLSAALPLALTASAFAQQPGGTQQQRSGQQAQQQNPAQQGQLQAKIRQNLASAGFTDIRMMPSSFMVRAKDRDGNPVMMIINPDSIEAVTFEGGSNNNGSTTGQGSTNQQPGGQNNRPSGNNHPAGNK